MGTFMPALRFSSKPILTAVQPLEQPISDPSCHLTNPIIGQGELAGEDYTHSSSMETGAGGCLPNISCRGEGSLKAGPLEEAIERQPAADKAAREEADKVFLDKTNKPKGLRRLSSSFKDLKAFQEEQGRGSGQHHSVAGDPNSF